MTTYQKSLLMTHIEVFLWSYFGRETVVPRENQPVSCVDAWD